jgi:pyruvate, water dikinase
VTAVPLSEATDLASYGGKAVALGQAIRGGLPVPGGIALSVAFVDAIKAGEATAYGVLERM